MFWNLYILYIFNSSCSNEKLISNQLILTYVKRRITVSKYNNKMPVFSHFNYFWKLTVNLESINVGLFVKICLWRSICEDPVCCAIKKKKKKLWRKPWSWMVIYCSNCYCKVTHHDSHRSLNSNKLGDIQHYKSFWNFLSSHKKFWAHIGQVYII